jgi:hypothetical protein
MIHEIPTAAGRLTIESSKLFGPIVKLTIKPKGIWPEVVWTLNPLEAGQIADALGLAATQAEVVPFISGSCDVSRLVSLDARIT